jgi:hypothetical protein
MSTEAEELHRIISASVREMLDAYRIQAQAGPTRRWRRSSSALSMAFCRALAPYPSDQRVAMLPSIVRMLLTTFLEDALGRAPWLWDQLVRAPRALTIAWRGRRLGMDGRRQTTFQ